MEKTRKLFISNLKKIRNARGLTQAAVAELVEISLSGYAQIEYGTSWPTPVTLGKLAEKLSVEIADFFIEKSDSQKKERKAELFLYIVTALAAFDESELEQILAHVDSAPSRRALRAKNSLA